MYYDNAMVELAELRMELREKRQTPPAVEAPVRPSVPSLANISHAASTNVLDKINR